MHANLKAPFFTKSILLVGGFAPVEVDIGGDDCSLMGLLDAPIDGAVRPSSQVFGVDSSSIGGSCSMLSLALFQFTRHPKSLRATALAVPQVPSQRVVSPQGLVCWVKTQI